jgi:hypothetical protein
MYLQYNELWILPAVKYLPHYKFVVTGNAIVGYWLCLLPCRECVCLNMLHVDNRRYEADVQMRHVELGWVCAACKICHCSVVAVLGNV